MPRYTHSVLETLNEVGRSNLHSRASALSKEINSLLIQISELKEPDPMMLAGSIQCLGEGAAWLRNITERNNDQDT